MARSILPQELGARAPAVFLAPHYDDVTLSCGGTVALLAATGNQPLVITVFGGEPEPGKLTGFARWQHERWGAAEGATQQLRRAEEGRAAAILGYRARWFEFRDAIYRGDRYLSDEALFGPLTSDEAPLATELAGRLRTLPELRGRGTLFVPLAVGNHVDHQLVFEAGRVLARDGIAVFGYEDFPYAALGDALDRRLVALSAGADEPLVIDISSTIARRVEAIAAYPSQLPVIFRFWSGLTAAVHAFALRTGGSVPAERYWPLPPEPV